MKWFKKQINKLFFSDEIDEEDEYFENAKSEEPIYKNENQNFDKNSDLNRKTTFRFPLISDEEFVSPTPAQQNRPEDSNYRFTQKHSSQPIELPRHLQKDQSISVVYDVEVSGIRELLEKRRHSKGTSSVKREPQKRRNIVDPSSVKVESSPKERTKQDVNVKQERDLSSPLENRKRFVPTKVPSPVYGFSKPSQINELLLKKQDQSELSTPTKQQNMEQEILFKKDTINAAEYGKTEIIKASEEISSSAVLIDVEEAHLQGDFNAIYKKRLSELPTSILEEIQEEVREETQEDKVEIQTSDEAQEEVQVETNEEREFETQEKTQVSLDAQQSEIFEDIEELPILVEEMVDGETTPHPLQEEQQPVEIEDENVEDNQNVKSEIEEQEDYEPIVEESPKQISKGSNLPFNVLMLKSDKEKLAAKLAQSYMENVEEKTNETNEQQLYFDHSLKKDEIMTDNPKEDDENIYSAEDKEQEVISIEEELAEVPPSETALEEIELGMNQQVNQLEEPAQIEKKPVKVYVKPSFEFLSPPEEKTEDREWMDSQGDTLVESLSHFQVTAQVESIMQGPAVTQFEITVGHGTKVSKIRNLSDDLKLALAAKDIRIQAPIPGKSSIGIEIPNRISRAVRLSEVTNSESFIDSESPLEAALGLDLTGKPVTIDLRKMPHGLIAGATGSGKSVCINSILVSLLYKADPHELKLMLIDPKMVELAPFNHIPHLVSPVITDVKAATAALKWAVEEMERRYQLFAHAGVRDLPRFNKLADSKGEPSHKLPYILIVIDELADLMMMSPADVEEAICRIAQKARACGIHLIVATQRPSVDVITGLIKSNIPTRIAFAVSSQIDSRTILDAQGAERLLGRGDMLYLGNGMSDPIRIQGTFVTDDEIEDIIEHIKQQGDPDYFFEHEELLKKTEMIEEQDELFEEVCRFVFEQGSASTSSIQRRYHIGYNRAARLIDMLERHGFISEQKGSKPRDVFITESELASMFD